MCFLNNPSCTISKRINTTGKCTTRGCNLPTTCNQAGTSIIDSKATRNAAKQAAVIVMVVIMFLFKFPPKALRSGYQKFIIGFSRDLKWIIINPG
jgi:hypothetical protein